MRCPTCRALNPDSADWCSQCFQPLATDPEPEAPVEPAAEPAAPPPPGVLEADQAPTADDAAVPSGAAPEPRPVRAGAGRFRQTEEGLDWRCRRCDQWNAIELTTCQVCGSTFGRAVTEEPGLRRDVSESTVLVASAAMPGLGHILMGQTLTGVARLATWLLWLVGGLWLLVESIAADGSIVPAVPLLLGAVVIWAVTPVDALSRRRGSDRELLTPRVFLWLVVAVLGGLLLTFLATAASLPDAGG